MSSAGGRGGAPAGPRETRAPRSRQWTTIDDVRQKVHREWDSGRLLAGRVPGDHGPATAFPLRIPVRRPSQSDLLARWDEVQSWSDALAGAPGIRVELTEVNHRALGRQRLPAEVWLDSPDDALGLIHQIRSARRFSRIIDLTPDELLPWLARRPFAALEVADQWPAVLSAWGWIREHPDSGLFLRQVDAPGVHTKIIERNRRLLDSMLAAVGVEGPPTRGSNWFERRYGFRTDPPLVRFRTLDPDLQVLTGASDLSMPVPDFAALAPPARRVFITENKVNFLSFPDAPDSLVVWGGGNAAPELLSGADWLTHRELYYWGDIDTHGFRILDRLRAGIPTVRSMLMDEATLRDHREFWSTDEQPTDADLEQLDPAEADLYDRLRFNEFGDRVRLEQERIRFSTVTALVRELTDS